MPETERVNTLPEGLTIGSAISQHHGMRCCPAVQKDTELEYFLKIIPIPANQDQAQALLLSGAYNSEEELDQYYKNQCDSLIAQIEVINSLHGKHEGFFPVEAYQANKLSRGVGYQLTMLTRRHDGLNLLCLTHREAIDFGIDICEALMACRAAGYLYINLKPSNLFRKGSGKWCIGDLGLLPMASLQYTALPESYRSEYTAPEIQDAFSQITLNADVYALGLMLYQLYNEGQLPDSSYAPARFADYELWRILEKACHPDPSQRWQSPDALHQALKHYRQNFIPGDIPLHAIKEEKSDATVTHKTFLTEAENLELLAPALDALPFETDDSDDDAIFTVIEADQDSEDPLDVADMLAQVDQLIQHQPPQPVVAPTAYEVSLPLAQEEPQPSLEEAIKDDEAVQPHAQTEEFHIEQMPEQAPEMEDDEDDSTPPLDNEPKLPVKKILKISLILAIILGVLIGAGAVYYNLFYSQAVNNMSVTVLDNRVTVTLDTNAPDSILRIVCADSYGNAFRSPVKNGSATIAGLNPGTQYDLSVEVIGFHRLTGMTSTMITTAARTQVLNLSAACGQLDGSVIISFSVDGAPCNIWDLHYNALNQQTQSISFSGTNVTVTGLTVGQTYNFRISAQSSAVLSGTTEIQYTAKAVVAPVDPTATVNDDNTVLLQWSANTDEAVTWQIRCYNTDGYDKTFTTGQCTYVLNDLDLNKEYTILLTAEGHTRSEMLQLSPSAADEIPQASAS